jgi:PcfJ-like protein
VFEESSMRERKRSASKDPHFIEARRERRRQEDARRAAEEARQAALASALARPRPGARQAVDRFLAADARADRRLRDLLHAVADRAPRLVRDDAFAAFRRMAAEPWVRPLSDWVPSGKGWDTLFRSLAEHLFARYPMPPFLWSTLQGAEDRAELVRVALHVAAGGSLFEAVKSGLFAVPLTRRMCHDVLLCGGDGDFLRVVRGVQVRSARGSARLLAAWLATDAGGRLHDRAGEVFWQGVLEWLSANPMLPDTEIGPLVDYIGLRRRQEPAFSIRGRSVLALLRGMREWHGALARERVVRQRVFRPSGFEPLDLDRSRKTATGHRTEIWHVREILDARALADEGRAMNHCVYSYAGAVGSGQCSIWTLTLEDGTGHWRRLTIEVRNAQRRIVQARGRFNRLPEPLDRIALDAWAGRNRLEVVL